MTTEVAFTLRPLRLGNSRRTLVAPHLESSPRRFPAEWFLPRTSRDVDIFAVSLFHYYLPHLQILGAELLVGPPRQSDDGRKGLSYLIRSSSPQMHL